MKTDALKLALQEGQVDVLFEKVDGTKRLITGTLNFDIIPVKDHPKSDKVKPKDNSVISVFDTEAGAWRSFRVENIIHWIVFNEDMIN
jgi:hypothetical protein